MKKAIVALALGLAGCTAPAPKLVTRTVTVQAHIPTVLQTCPPMPQVPPFTSNHAIADYILRLWTNDSTCHQTLRQAVASVQGPGK